MKSAGAFIRPALPVLLFAAALVAPCHVALAQDSAFLACDRFADRGQRIACLEDALEAATEERAPAASPGAATAVNPAPAERPVPDERAAPAARPAPVTVPPPATAPPPATVAEDDGDDDPSLLDRLRNFGRDDSATISTDPQGQDQLHDTIAALEKRRDLWIVTLAGGQVWMQEYPRTLNLREGDQVTIYQAGFGNGYRLATERLSGFIRVKRVR